MAEFEVRGWDIERFVPEYVREMIDKAADRGMNAIGLSHAICMNVEEILYDWHRHKHLEGFCRQARERGMQVYLWTHEVNGPVDAWVADDGRLRLDDPALYDWIAGKYRTASRKVPSCEGFILSLTESRFQVHRENSVVTTMRPAERMARVVNAVRDGCAQEGKRLIVRDFLRSPAEMDAFLEAMGSVPDDVWVYTKCVPNDWQFRYPPHPLLGRLDPHKQIMEMDLATEAGGIKRWPMCIPEYIQQMLRLAREKGLAGVIPRCDDGYATNIGTPNEINVYAYSILIHDPDADVDRIWRDWCRERYGERAAGVAESVLRRTFDLVCAMQYTLGFWTGSGCKFPAIRYTDGHLINHSSAIWDPSPENKRIEQLLLAGGPEAVDATVAEKVEAERISRQCLDELDSARGAFTIADYDQLRGYFERAARDARTGQKWARAYFALRWFRNTKSAEASRELEDALEECRRHLESSPDAVYEPDKEAVARFIEEAEGFVICDL